MMDTILTISTSLQNQLRKDNYCKFCGRFQAQISTQTKRDRIKSRTCVVVDALISLSRASREFMLPINRYSFFY